MAASEDQSQAIVRDFICEIVRFGDNRHQTGLQVFFKFFLQARAATETIDGLVACGLNDPGARKFGNAGSGPLINGCGKCLLGRVFRDVKVTEVMN